MTNFSPRHDKGSSSVEPPVLSIVMAVLNEADNILPVCQEISETLSQLPATEILAIDDGSTDETVERLLEARHRFVPSLRIISHPKRLGKSAALRTGVTAARGKWVATIDGDGQDDPVAIVSMLERARASNGAPPLVVGVRRKRNDRLSRRLATRLANGLRRRLLNDGCPDTGAPLKLFSRDLFLRMPQFEGVHRFLPALLGHYGAPLICIEVKHRARLHGTSKYTNLNRALVGIRDMLGVMWLQNRTHLPDHLTER
ncbi:glycosyltransferase family 2 protein [Gluconobacter wancherniae]|uniref:Dolichol-phosphate mannosyltransferase n=1 Tax=Gluconobacter wancherniae NBRC 103581 TaxID=656744 RepID=A0A511B1Y9_9PROT|nr:glycosyltransferase family 2 protein [Gluconobacter wancherniae]MBF0854551.1 glycosyltransferase family 2 protein [Gluconobacter wancherniae]GBD57724.1 dolichol-phosphate mannosyltransferase [Gluconobacter wancherniae NBRC 103581]GBR62389.1 glycosyltransferase [Gluconobacter wancherniae NBRC 103581]GEK94418.1 dolichol-phosphate mannosyltransferase [Gluconobacter wancherniae NBRC 103581]